MYNKLGNYQDDGRGQYNFTYTDNEGKHVSVSFRADNDYDLDIIFNEFRNFLLAANHDIEGEIGELYHDNEDYDDESQIHQDKFSMDHLPNNGWPFGALTSVDISTLKAPQHDWSKVNQYPTMAPLTQEQVKSWTLDTKDIQAFTTADIEALTFKMPGTTGGAKVSFK